MSLDDHQPDDPADIIARAKREAAAKRAEQMFERMREDDERDEQDGVELSDSSQAAGGSVADSADEWDLSGRASSRRGSSVVDAYLQQEDSLPGGATMAEGEAKAPTTLNVPIEAQSMESSGDITADLTTTRDLPVPIFRPERRPPMAMLIACDDGSPTGEMVRLRKASFEVGRVDGDLVIDHDHQMSRRHFRIDRRQTSSGWEWELKDLDSLNGTFLQQPSAQLSDRDELLLAGEVIRIQLPPGGGLVLTKVAAGHSQEKATLSPGQHVLGSDGTKCVPFMATAPLLAAQHLRLVSDRAGRWTAAALPETDGMWLRTPGFPLENGTQWQTGEQRFIFRLP